MDTTTLAKKPHAGLKRQARKKSRAGRKPLTRDNILDSYIYYKVVNMIVEGNQHHKRVTLAWLTMSKIPHEDDKNRYYQKSWILKVIKRLRKLGIVVTGENGGYTVTPWHRESNTRMNIRKRMWQDKFNVIDNSVYVWGDIVDFPRFKEEIQPTLKDLANRITLEWTKWVFGQVESELRTVIKDKDCKLTHEELAYVASNAGERIMHLLEQLGWPEDFIDELRLKGTIAHIVEDSGLGLTSNKNKVSEMRRRLREGVALDKEATSRIENEVFDKVFRRTKTSASPLIVIPIELPPSKEARKNLLDYLARMKQTNSPRAQGLR